MTFPWSLNFCLFEASPGVDRTELINKTIFFHQDCASRKKERKLKTIHQTEKSQSNTQFKKKKNAQVSQIYMIYTYTVLSQDLFHTWTYDMNLSISMKNTQAGLESHKSFLKQAALTLTFVMALWLQRSIKVALWLQHCDNKGHPNWNKSHKPGCSLGREKCVREEPESRTSAYSHPLRLPFLTSPWDTACNTHTQQNQMPWPFKLLPKLFSFLPFNPFRAQACKLSRLKDAGVCLQAVYFPVL